VLLRPWLANESEASVVQPDAVATVLASERWQQWLLDQGID
jgi:hypothetical protein